MLMMMTKMLMMKMMMMRMGRRMRMTLEMPQQAEHPVDITTAER